MSDVLTKDNIIVNNVGMSNNNSNNGNNGNGHNPPPNPQEPKCEPYEGVLNCYPIERVEINDECGQFFSFDLSKMPIISIYPSGSCRNTLVITLDFDNNKQFKFYTNKINRKNSSIPNNIVFLSIQTFKSFIINLGLNYDVDSFL